MNFNEFNQLDEATQLDWIWNNSHLAKSISYPGYKVVYYKIEDFYVMAKYDLAAETITDIEAIQELPAN